jgi:glycosyltransferase involved in cell wall biosynthesis
MYAHLCNHAYIAHFHGVPGASGRAGFLLRAYRPLVLGPILRGARAVVVFTEEQRSIVAEQFGVDSARISVIPNGVDESFLYDGTRFLHSKPRLLFVGRFVVQKNLLLLLRALEGISSLFDTTLVGEGELEGELKKAVVDLGLENVHFYGLADGADLRELYRNADVFVLPSKGEGMPLVLLEAMAMGLPIVATNIPGIRGVVADGQNGILVPPEEPSAFRTALLNMVSDPDRYRCMSEESRRLADKYSWGAACAEFEKLYEAASKNLVASLDAS